MSSYHYNTRSRANTPGNINTNNNNDNNNNNNNNNNDGNVGSSAMHAWQAAANAETNPRPRAGVRNDPTAPYGATDRRRGYMTRVTNATQLSHVAQNMLNYMNYHYNYFNRNYPLTDHWYPTDLYGTHHYHMITAVQTITIRNQTRNFYSITWPLNRAMMMDTLQNTQEEVSEYINFMQDVGRYILPDRAGSSEWVFQMVFGYDDRFNPAQTNANTTPANVDESESHTLHTTYYRYATLSQAADQLYEMAVERMERYRERRGLVPDTFLRYFRLNMFKKNRINQTNFTARQRPINAQKGRLGILVLDKYTVVIPHTRKNCFFQAVEIALKWQKKHTLLYDKQVMNNYGKTLKRHVGLGWSEFTGEYEIRVTIAKSHQPFNIDIYEPDLRTYYDRYHVKTMFKNGDEILRQHIPKLKRSYPTIKLVYFGEHIAAMIPNADLKNMGIFESTVKPRGHCFSGTPEQRTQLLKDFLVEDNYLEKIPNQNQRYDPKRKKYISTCDNCRYLLIGAWDIETYAKDAQGNEIDHRPYAVGLATHVMRQDDRGNEDDEDFIYKDFYGESCLKDMFIYLYENRKYYNGYTFYAHNAGKFDHHVLFKYGLFEIDQYWYIERFLTQDNAIIQIVLRSIEKGDLQEQSSTTNESSSSTSSSTGNTRDSNDLRVNAQKKYAGTRQGKRGKGKSEPPCRIYLHDSMKLLSGSLRQLLKEFKTAHQKEDMPHEDVREDNWRDNLERFEVQSYLKHDVIGLLEMMEKFSISTWTNALSEHSDQKMRININKTLTGASLAKKNFFQNYYASLLEEGRPIYKLPKWLDKYIRKGYYGGRNEAFALGNLHEVYPMDRFYYYDFTSLYPSVARNPLPYGKPVFIKDGTLVFDDEGYIRKDFHGFVRVKVRGPFQKTTTVKNNNNNNISSSLSSKHDNVVPLHCAYHDDKLVFPVFEDDIELVLFSEEIRYAQERGMGYIYTFVDAVCFDMYPLLKEVMEDSFARKAQEKSKGNTASTLVFKLNANSTYGFFGLITEKRDGVRVYHEDKSAGNICEKIDLLIEENRFKAWTKYGKYHIVRCLNDLPTKTFNIAIASAITSYARMRMHSLLQDIRNAGGRLYYCDTDSVISNLQLTKHPDLRKKYQWDNTGDELGSLKNVCLDENVDLKKYPQEAALEDNDPGYDEMIILGCKNYALRRWTKHPDNVYATNNNNCNGLGRSQKITKMKGMRKSVPIVAHYNPYEDPLKVPYALPDIKGQTPQYLEFYHYEILGREPLSTMSCGLAQHNNTTNHDPYAHYARLCNMSSSDYLTPFILQAQTQFRAGLWSLTQSKYEGGIRMSDINKKVTRNYNKGVLNPFNHLTYPLHIYTQPDTYTLLKPYDDKNLLTYYTPSRIPKIDSVMYEGPLQTNYPYDLYETVSFAE